MKCDLCKTENLKYRYSFMLGSQDIIWICHNCTARLEEIVAQLTKEE